MTLGNLGGNTDHGTPHLRRQTESLISWKVGGHLVHVGDKVHRPLKRNQVMNGLRHICSVPRRA